MKTLLKVANIDYVEEVEYSIVGKETKLKTAILKELDIDRWNSLAERTNTISFERMVGRKPVNYAEVKEWVRSLIEKPKKDTRIDYGKILKKCRLRAGLTQQRLSFELYYSREIVSKIETGRKKVDLQTFMDWIRATGTEKFVLEMLGIYRLEILFEDTKKAPAVTGA